MLLGGFFVFFKLTSNLLMLHSYNMGFPGSSVGKEFACNAEYPGSIPGLGWSPGEGIGYPFQYTWASLMAQLVKNPPAVQEDPGSIPGSLGSGRSPGGGHGNPLQYSCLENPHGQRSLVGYNPRGLKELDTTMTKHSTATISFIKSYT